MARIEPIYEFKADHAKVRDSLLNLIEAINEKNAFKALEILVQLDRLVGPHFRWEEECLYPIMEKFFGRQYHLYLLSAHDRIVKRAKELLEVLKKGSISSEEAKTLVDIIRNEILPHPIECEGITLFAEKLTEKELERLRVNLERNRRENVPLLEWADKIKDAERKKRGIS